MIGATLLLASAVFSAPVGAASSCEADFSMAGLLSGLAAGKIKQESVDPREVVSFYAYKALAAGDEKSCAALKALPFKGFEGKSWRDSCRAVFYELAFGRALATRSREVPRYCEGALATDKDFDSLSRAKKAEVCRWEYVPIPPFCERLSSLFKEKEERRGRCARFLESLVLGEGKNCAESSDAEDVSRCRQYVLFHRARTAGDAGLCANEEICLAFMGGAAAVSRGYETKIKARACRVQNN